jgi:hypothetical protein
MIEFTPTHLRRLARTMRAMADMFDTVAGALDVAHQEAVAFEADSLTGRVAILLTGDP